MRNFNRFLLFSLMFFLVVSSVSGAYRPVPDNRDLGEIFNSIKVDGKSELTRVRYVPDNDEAWYCRWKMIKQAKDTIDCTYYIIDKDIFGQAFLGLLLNRARHGVRIRLMIDGRVYRMPYMSKMPDKIQELAAFPNVEIKLYNSVSKSLAHLFKGVKQVFASNHDKIIIVDNETCIVGGRNIGADYFSGKGENDIVYRDTDVLMQGRYVAKQLTKAFEEEWNLLRNSVVKEDFINFKDQLATVDLAYRVMSRYMQGRGLFDPEKVRVSKKLVKALKEMNKEISKYKNISSYSGFRLFRGERKKPVKILDKHSHIGALNGITPNLIKMIDACEREIIIQNPYLVITEEAEAALKRAAQRGVKIIFHTNSAESTDSPFPQAFLLNDWKRILQEMPGARLLVAPSQNERLHSKTFVFDSLITIVGSYNMDPLSEQINSEVVAAIYDKSFSTRTRLQIIKKDLKKFIEYRIETNEHGEIIKAYGPKDHVNEDTLKRLKILSKIGWLRPLI
jgi:putative cardiolipin synthase